MATDEPSRWRNLRYTAEVAYLRARSWLSVLGMAAGVLLVTLGGVLLFTQTMALGFEASRTILEALESVGIPTDVLFLYYIVAGLILVLVTK